jgi:hypothetical protein
MAAATDEPRARVTECAVREVKQNDADEQVRDTVSKGWSKDQWISGVMERAIGIVARSAEKGQQEFKLTPWAAEAVRFSVQDDKNLSTFYKEQGEFTTKHLATYFPIRNIDLDLDETIHIQGTQRPDSISLLKLSGADTERKVCICFEGDGHNLDQGKSKSGMYMHEKMLQGASLCHDINPRVPAIFVTSALWKHDRDKFQTFSAWSDMFLQAHVALVEQLMQYINNRKTSSIDRKLQEMHPDKKDTREFDFFCWINAKRTDAQQTVESDVGLCFDLMASDAQRDSRSQSDDFRNVLAWRKTLSGQEKTLDRKINDAQLQAADGLLRHRFSASVISTSTGDIPIVIFAVPRVDMKDVQALANDKKHACAGMWYPMHVHSYVTAMRTKDMNNFLTPRALKNESFVGKLSDLPHSDASRLISRADLARYIKGIEGHVLFAMPWLWINIGFLCKLKSSMTYTVAKNNANTLKMYVNFTRKHATQINSRDTVKNPMQMFKGNCTSLFSYVCRQRNLELDFDNDLTSFFEQKCGWTSPTQASSPAVFFKMIGAGNLITAHTLARQIKCKASLGEKLEQTKSMFPLAAQVEIDYALECLCRHYYFAQDTTAEPEGFVRKQDFDIMQRKLREQLREANARAERARIEEEQSGSSGDDKEPPDARPSTPPLPSTPPVDAEEFPGVAQKARLGKKYVAPDGWELVDDLTNDQMNIEYLKDRPIVVCYKLEKGAGYMWYPGTIVDQAGNGRFEVQYKGETDATDEELTDENYGSFWAMLVKSSAS